MTLDSASDRYRLSRKLAAVKQGVAKAATEVLFETRPELDARYGPKGREFCTTDFCFHVDFLAGAIEAGSPQAFAEYSRWTTRMLAARGIEPGSFSESLAHLGRHLSTALLPEEHEAMLPFLTLGREAAEQGGPPSPRADSVEDGLALARQVFLSAILGGQRQAAINVVEEALRQGHSHVDIYVGVFAECLHRVGELWEMNKISVAQEHIATSITQYAIALTYPKMVQTSVRRGNMIVTGVAGEMHQIGANLVADTMEANGWTVQFLGTNVPHSSVLAAVEASAASVLCISTTIVANLPSASELVRTVRAHLGNRAPRILLGGAAYRQAGSFSEELGQMGAIADLRRAVALLCP